MLTALSLEAQSHALHAKLLTPRVPPDLVARPALLARLEKGLDRKLTLIAAPAGYGKTTLLAAWLRETTRPVAYLHLDEYDAVGVAFVSALVAALQTLAPDVGRSTLLLLRLRALPPIGVLARMLATEIATLPQASVLVLDDYHTLNSPDADQLLTALLRQLPPQLHLIVATRQEPALAIPRLRARAELSELRADDLRFDHETARAFLARALAADVPPELLAQLVEQTEGWAAGLRLAALAPRDLAAQSAGVDAQARRYVHDFLLDDVLAAQELSTQRFLLATSIFDRFCVPLCDTTLAGTPEAGSAQEHLTDLQRRNLFLVPLGHGGWYRYHALFREALHERLTATSSAGAIVALHQRASAWLADAGLVEEAVRQALAAADEAAAAAILERHVPAKLGREEWPQVERWLDLLPQALVHRRPALLLARAWVHYLRYQFRAIPPLLAAADALLAEPSGPDDAQAAEPLRGQVAALQSALLSVEDRQAESRDAAWRAWERLPPTHPYPRGVTAALLVLTSQALGEGAQTAARLAASLDDPAETNPYSNLRVRSAVCNRYLADGNLPALKEVAARASEDAMALGQELTLAWAHYFLGRVHYEWNELAEAQAHFEAVRALRHKCHFMVLWNAMHGLALTEQARGQTEAAAETLATLGEWVAQLQDKRMEAIEQAFTLRLALLRGDQAPATGLPPPEAPAPPAGALALEHPRTTRLRALLSQGTEVALRQAAAEGAALLARYEADRNWMQVVEVLGLQAQTHQALDASTLALDALERALRLAEPGGRVRVFVDLGAPMARLLARYAARRGESPYLTRLLAAYGTTPASSSLRPPGSDSPRLQPVEPLTRRELEILQHLQARRTNDEIAEALSVSVDTVKKHARNIYQKLKVEGRYHAVTQAISLGLLIPAPTVKPQRVASARPRVTVWPAPPSARRPDAARSSAGGQGTRKILRRGYRPRRAPRPN
jgi:LuxR family maltose regulon positive regulatory protein